MSTANKIKSFLQPRDWWPRAYFWFVMVVAVVTGCVEYSELETESAKAYTLGMQQVRIDSCEYLIGLGPEMLMGSRTVHIIIHKANCDNHGSKP